MSLLIPISSSPKEIFVRDLTASLEVSEEVVIIFVTVRVKLSNLSGDDDNGIFSTGLSHDLCIKAKFEMCRMARGLVDFKIDS